MTQITTENNNIIIYENQDGKPNISVRIEGETVWLTQVQLAELFLTTKQNISLHIKNIFEEGELKKEATVKEYLTVQKEVVRKFRTTALLKNYQNLTKKVEKKMQRLRTTQTRNNIVEEIEVGK